MIKNGTNERECGMNGKVVIGSISHVQKRKHTFSHSLNRNFRNFADCMNKGRKETIMTRVVSCTFVVLALAVFKPFGLDTLHWQTFFHLFAIWVMGIGVCMLTDVILKYIVRMPRSYKHGVGYIIRRNLWFQLINTPIVALCICLYRHFVLSNRIEGNQLSWGNYLETLLIIAFCSFAIGLYWRFKFRSKYLAAELEETRLLNEQLQCLQSESAGILATTDDVVGKDVFAPTATPQDPLDKAEEQNSHPQNQRSDTSKRNDSATSAATSLSQQSGAVSETVTLKGTTSDSITLQIPHLLYIEAVGNYVKVFHLSDGRVRSDMLRTTSKQIEDDLRAYPMIVRCHRAFLVNLGQVEQFVSKSGTMQLLIRHCHEFLPVSRSNMAQIKNAILR